MAQPWFFRIFSSICFWRNVKCHNTLNWLCTFTYNCQQCVENKWNWTHYVVLLKMSKCCKICKFCELFLTDTNLLYRKPHHKLKHWKKGPGSVSYQEEFNKDFIGRELVGDFSWSSNVDCAHIVHNPLAVVWQGNDGIDWNGTQMVELVEMKLWQWNWVKWNLHGRSAYKMELTWEVGIHAKALCAVSPPAHCPNQLIHASRCLEKNQFCYRHVPSNIPNPRRKRAPDEWGGPRSHPGKCRSQDLDLRHKTYLALCRPRRWTWRRQSNWKGWLSPLVVYAICFGDNG